MDTYGGFGPATDELLRTIGKRAAIRTSRPYSVVICEMRQQLSACVDRSIGGRAHMVLARMPDLPPFA